MRRKSICKVIILCMCLVVGSILSPVTSHAQEANVQVEPRVEYIASYGAELTISSSGIATCNGSVRGSVGVSSTYVKITLQQYVSGAWQDVESWEALSSGRSTSISETYQVSKGTNRVVATCQANSEVKEAISTSETY